VSLGLAERHHRLADCAVWHRDS